MVRRGSTVRVRQRALQNTRSAQFSTRIELRLFARAVGAEQVVEQSDFPPGARGAGKWLDSPEAARGGTRQSHAFRLRFGSDSAGPSHSSSEPRCKRGRRGLRAQRPLLRSCGIAPEPLRLHSQPAADRAPSADGIGSVLGAEWSEREVLHARRASIFMGRSIWQDLVVSHASDRPDTEGLLNIVWRRIDNRRRKLAEGFNLYWY